MNAAVVVVVARMAASVRRVETSFLFSTFIRFVLSASDGSGEIFGVGKNMGDVASSLWLLIDERRIGDRDSKNFVGSWQEK